VPGILSQREIDALLSALPTVEAPLADAPRSQQNKPVKTYDFRRPDKFSKDQIRTLELIHDNFARRAGITLSAHLRALVQINLMSIEQVIYDEFVQQVPTPAVLYAMTLDPLPGRAMLELHPSVAFIIIDRLLGGQGRALNRSRELTEVEMALLEVVVWEVLAGMKEGWSNVTTLLPKLTGDVGFTPQFLPIATATEICLVIAFEIRYGEESGLMRLCLPYVLLEPVLGQLTAQTWYASSRSTLPPERRAHLRQNLEAVRVPLVAVLGTADLPVEEVLNLQKGDVIPLDTLTTADLTLNLAGRPKFRGRPGRIGRNLAVRIGEVLDEDDPLDPLGEDADL
jgi:flagellar motor switch protein FliM